MSGRGGSGRENEEETHAGGADDLRRRETDSWESGLDVAEIKGDL